MLNAVRAIFLILCGVAGGFIGDHFERPEMGILYGIGIALSVLLLEGAFARRFLGVLSVLMIGLLCGFIVAHFMISALHLIPALRETFRNPEDPMIPYYVEFGITFVMCSLFVLAALHTKDEFKFVIPFVELKREGQGGRAMLLDTSAIIDGRIADVVETGAIEASMIVPRFVLQELQQVADSADKTKRARGRRGLDILARLQQSKRARLEIQDVLLPDVEGVDAKLVRMAKMLDASVVTTDFNLNKVAQVQGVSVVNLNDLAGALRPPLLQGDALRLRVQKTGESPGQGVGYLEDGTMVVAEECAGRIGQEVDLTVSNILQTSAGRMVFARPVGSSRQS